MLKAPRKTLDLVSRSFGYPDFETLKSLASRYEEADEHLGQVSCAANFQYQLDCKKKTVPFPGELVELPDLVNYERIELRDSAGKVHECWIDPEARAEGIGDPDSWSYEDFQDFLDREGELT